LDGAQLSGNDVEGFNNLWGCDLSLFESSMVFSSLLSELFFLLGQDFQLCDLVGNVGLEEIDFTL
jgi:hypothetical protein